MVVCDLSKSEFNRVEEYKSEMGEKERENLFLDETRKFSKQTTW